MSAPVLELLPAVDISEGYAVRPVGSGELGADFMRRWVASLAVTGRLSSGSLSSGDSATAAGGN